MTLTSTQLAIKSNRSLRKIIRNPTLQDFQAADSVHVLAFTSQRQLLVAESEGSFTLDDWDEVYEIGKDLCCHGIETADDDDGMQGGELDETTGGMMSFVKSTMEEKVSLDLHWKD